MAETRRTLCNRDCPDACSILATVEKGRATQLRGDPDHPVTRGFLCFRTGHFLEKQYAPDRLTTPLLRDGDSFRPIGWDDALDLAARHLERIRAESGPAAIFHYRSGGSLGLLAHLTDAFFARFGPVTTKRGDICSGAGDAAQLADFGDEDSNDLFDLQHARNIVLWGKNVFVSSPHTIPLLRDAKARGAGLILIDPLHHKTATLCDRFVQPRPGGDFALAMAVARQMFERAWVAPRASDWCDRLDEFRALAFRHDVSTWCAQADVTPDVAEDIARRLAEGPTTILVGWGMGRRVNGAGIVRALDALGAISGNLGIRGGGVSFYFKRRGAFDTSFAQPTPPPRTVCEPLFGAEILGMRDPPIRAVWITAGNPVCMLPDSNVNAEALRTREFVVVVDSFMTDTARLAHLVLPTTTLLEADDVLGSYGHHWIGVAKPVVERPPGVRSDLEIMQGIASRVGLGAAMAGSADEWKRRLIRADVTDRGVSVERLEQGAVRNPIAPQVLFEGRRFATATGRVNLVTEAPPEASGDVDPTFALVLLAISTERSQSSQWTREPEGLAVCTVHPESAGGVEDGGEAWLESRVDRIRVRVRHDPRQRRDVAIVPKGGSYHQGRCANALVRARTTDLGEGGALYDQRVRLSAVAATD